MSVPLLLDRADVERLLVPDVCIAAVEDAFRALALGEVAAPGILGMHVESGGFHVKAGLLKADRAYFAAKINANFPGNAMRGLPTIQGLVTLFDATDGRVLAVMDSTSITALRTAAASAVAVKYLAAPRRETLLICGCGGQAREQLRALLRVCRPQRVLVHDRDASRATRFAAAQGAELAIPVTVASRLDLAVAESDVIVTCTTAPRFIIADSMVRPGTFIAAVGADHGDKQEIDPLLLARSKVVTDLTVQAAAIGDLHHAITAGLMASSDVHAQLGEVVAGARPGREHPDEIVVFDSTGTGLQDVAAAIALYRIATAQSAGTRFDFGSPALRNGSSTREATRPIAGSTPVAGVIPT